MKPVIRELIENCTIYISTAAVLIAFFWRFFAYLEIKVKEHSVGASAMLRVFEKYQVIEDEIKRLEENDQGHENRTEEFKQVVADLRDFVKLSFTILK